MPTLIKLIAACMAYTAAGYGVAMVATLVVLGNALV